MSTDKARIVLLLMENERWSGIEAIKRIAQAAEEEHSLSVEEALVLGRKQTRAAARESIHTFIKSALRNGYGIWMEAPERSSSPSTREATRLAIGLAAFLGLDIYLGARFELFAHYQARRSSRVAVDNAWRVAQSCREIATDLACESLIADCTNSISMAQQSHSIIGEDLQLEATLLRRIGLSTSDIVSFVNAIAAATKGKLITESDLLGLATGSNELPSLDYNRKEVEE